jgi:hypothetical protein
MLADRVGGLGKENFQTLSDLVPYMTTWLMFGVADGKARGGVSGSVA